MSRKTRILLVCMRVLPFIQKDLGILKKHYEVRIVDFDKKTPFYLLRGFINLLKGVLWADLTYSWFANAHALMAVLLSKIFCKKSIVIAGGYDVANEPDIKYGSMQHPIFKYFTIYTFRYANLILAFSYNAKTEIEENAKIKKVNMVYLGLDNNTFYPAESKNDNLIITVGNVCRCNLERKGLLTFVQSAKYLPNMKFILIGKHSDDSIIDLKKIATKNVEFSGYLSNEELLKFMQIAKVYVQVSAHEGFGMALAEAMLCECVPVVSRRGSLPEVVGDAGFYVHELTPEETARQIETAIHSDLGKKARERIVNNFSIEKREEELMKLIE